MASTLVASACDWDTWPSMWPLRSISSLLLSYETKEFATANLIIEHHGLKQDIGIGQLDPNKYIKSRSTFLSSWHSDPIIRYQHSVRIGSTKWHCSMSISDHWRNRRASFAHAGAYSNGQLAKGKEKLQTFRIFWMFMIDWTRRNWGLQPCRQSIGLASPSVSQSGKPLHLPK